MVNLEKYETFEKVRSRPSVRHKTWEIVHSVPLLQGASIINEKLIVNDLFYIL